VVIDGDVDVLVAVTTHPVALVPGGVEGATGEAAELLDVEMQNVSRCCVLVARIDGHWLQIADAIELETAQDAADGGSVKAGMTCDPAIRPALPPQGRDPLELELLRRAMFILYRYRRVSCGFVREYCC
jgi:hypothetical protein